LARRSNSTGDKLRNVPHCGPDSRIHPDQAAKPRFAQEQAMNKAEFVDAVADAAELSKADAARAVDAMVGAITKALKKGDSVTLVGFGTFDVR
jgi:hypothetical protein